jgi:endogenous inhibitor of DNA gyrase (YacG/DUF329 family)
MTHFVSNVQDSRRRYVTAVCGRVVVWAEHSSTPTCPICKRIVNEEDAGE